MLENGADPNLPLYDIFSDSIDNGLDYIRYEATYHILDHVSDKAMIKLLRSYGAKTSREMAEEERKKREQERKRKKQEHETRSNALVDSLLNKRQLPVCG